MKKNLAALLVLVCALESVAMAENASTTRPLSECEAALLQKTAEGIGLVLSFDPTKVDKDSSKKAMDLYGSMLIEGLLECPAFRSRVEEGKAIEMLRKGKGGQR